MGVFRDLSNLRFERLTVLERAPDRNGKRMWRCRCDCGLEKIIEGGNLCAGRSRSCGCLQSEARQDRLIDLTGQRFGRLTVLGLAEMRAAWSYWATICDCGKSKIAKSALLRQGHTRSCGCLSSETTAARNAANKKHGQSFSPEYRAWRGMKDRCGNPKTPKYHLYGGRGIRVCDEWLNSFSTFFTDMGSRPSPQHSIDRFPNGDGNYEPGNCRWATASQQNSNRRTYTRRRSIKESAHGHR